MAHLRRTPAGSVRTIVGALGVALVAGPLAGSAAADTVTRLEAEDNVSAAIAWSAISYADGSADEALLARDDVFADSLASGGAQARLRAPLLLTPSEALDPRTAAELERLGVDRVTILGGEAAVSSTVETTLTSLGYETRRIGGATRIETAIAVANEIFPASTQIVVARAFGDDEDPTRAFADSLATGAYASSAAISVVYTHPDALPSATADYLATIPVERIAIAGGTDAVSGDVEAELGASGTEVVRIAGENRFATAVAMAADLGFATAGRADRVLLVEGQHPDAWASGFAAASQAAGAGAPLVLANGEDLPAETQDFLTDAAGRIPLVCGPYTSEQACNAAAEAMGNA